ncbi:unnamed protein product [Bursaphelenchus xylophilus]|uniref:(pine wood nematode) hypothetical protein n=1 Tax=Bursaphelenchus xylophilus TaxID=6326 RepID=A0A1I7SF29_BURXY|nr:unnamed protein product [Bursaphelenchus xylophilus]CAG9078944.1 unnamed protein product [Bursaphelenchus xylophilus]
MRRLIVILWPCLLSSAINAIQIEEGEIKNFIEVFVKSRGNDSNGELYFALTTYNESLSVFQTQELVEVRGGEIVNTVLKLAPFGDSYQIHSFVHLSETSITIYSNNPYEKNISRRFDQPSPQSFTYRNLIFVDNLKFYKSQDIQLENFNYYLYDIDSNVELPGYFPDNKTLGRIPTECFDREKITCGIDRDTGELEIFDESEGKTSYMYRAFNFSVPWECSKRFCNFTNLLTGEEYEIPSDLKTFVGGAPGERIAMVPLLTIQSPLVVEQLKRYGNSAAGIEGFWFTLVLVYFLKYMFE